MIIGLLWLLSRFGLTGFGVLLSDVLYVQSAQPQPDIFNCSNWDTQFLNSFESGLAFTVLVVFLLIVSAPMVFGKNYWVLTRRWMRIAWLGVVGGVVMAAFYIGLPLMRLGILPYESVHQNYRQCESNFEPEGFFGFIGEGTKAIDQVPTMILLAAGATAIGIALAFVAEEVAKKWAGLESKVR